MPQATEPNSLSARWRKPLLQGYALYRDGLKAMVLGRLLWKIILIKLALISLVGALFFPDYLAENFTTDADRGRHVLDRMTESRPQSSLLRPGRGATAAAEPAGGKPLPDPAAAGQPAAAGRQH
jgi:hypothetical protein